MLATPVSAVWRTTEGVASRAAAAGRRPEDLRPSEVTACVDQRSKSTA